MWAVPDHTAAVSKKEPNRFPPDFKMTAFKSNFSNDSDGGKID